MKNKKYLLLLVFIGIASWAGAFVLRSQRLSHLPLTFDQPVLLAIQLNVGQGDSFLLVSPDHKVTLVDGGPLLNTSGHHWDAGIEVILPTLKGLGLKAVDQMIITHHDQDHMGGFLSLLACIPVKQVFDNGRGHSSQSYRLFLDLVARRHVPFRRLGQGDVLELGQHLQAQVLSPQIEPGMDDNAASLVLRITFGNLKLLLTGDIESPTERTLCGRYGEGLHCDFLKSPHHGSKTSSSENFLSFVNPRLIGISAGRSNPYGHPSPKILSRYEKLFGTHFLRTDQEGGLMLVSNGSECFVATQKGKREVLNLN